LRHAPAHAPIVPHTSASGPQPAGDGRTQAIGAQQVTKGTCGGKPFVNSEMLRHWAIEPGLTFLNHGSFGATPRVVLEQQRELRDRMESDPIRFLDTELPGRLAVARERVAAFLHADPQDLVFQPNATSGINAVLRSLAPTLRPGDQLLTTNHEYNATLNALTFVAAQAGAKVVVANVPLPVASADDVVDAVMSRVMERTRLAMFSWVTSATALVFPVQRLTEALAARGVEVLVDAAHAPGMVPVDIAALERSGMTYFAANGHKWLCSPKGASVLWVRRYRQPVIHPLVISHGTNAPLSVSGRSRFQLEFEWPGTPDPTPFLCLPDAIEFVGGLVLRGWPEVMAANRTLALVGRSILEPALLLPTAYRLAPDEMIGAMATIPLPDGLEPSSTLDAIDDDPDVTLAGDPLHDELLTQDRIQVPVFAWPARPSLGPARRYVRISAQLYNEPADYQRLADALSRRLSVGRAA
jgi:isopenicillin-N epimerase